MPQSIIERLHAHNLFAGPGRKGLKALREKVTTEGGRVERQLAEYAELNQSVIQLTKIISEGLTHLKNAPALPKANGLVTT